MLSNEIKDRLAKVYALVNNAGTEGEKAAAQKALERILERYNLTEEALINIDRKAYAFKYSSMLEAELLASILTLFIEDGVKRSVRVNYNDDFERVKQVESMLTYLEWVEVESAYEYFRRHMKTQWLKISKPVLKKCRTNKARIKKRKELQDVFITRYLIASNLFKPENLKTYTVTSARELKDIATVGKIEGGTYVKQMTDTKLLEL